MAPTDARQVRSRTALTRAMLDLLQEKLFDQITIREISARAGTGYATFFRHYPSKEALLGDIAAQEISSLLNLTVPVLFDVNSLESTHLLYAHVDERRALWTALLIGGASAIVREEFVQQALDMTRDRPTAPGSWLPPDLGVIYGAGATIDFLTWWLAEAGDLPSDEVATLFHRLVIGPLMGITLG